MTVNVQVRKGARVVITESLATATLQAREKGEEINVIVFPGATVVVAEDGATAEELAALVGSG